MTLPHKKLLAIASFTLLSTGIFLFALLYSGILLLSHWQLILAPCVACMASFTQNFFVASHLVPLATAVFALVGLIRGGLFLKREIAFFRSTTKKQVSTGAVTCIKNAPLPAWSGGLLRPQMYVDCQFWQSLSVSERRALQEHEQSHIDQRENLQFFLLGWTAAILPGIGWFIEQFLERLRLASELTADQRALQATSRQAMATLLCKALQFRQTATLGYAPAINTFLHQRISHVTNTGDKTAPLPLRYLLSVIGFLALAGATLFFWIEPIQACVS